MDIRVHPQPGKTTTSPLRPGPRVRPGQTCLVTVVTADRQPWLCYWPVASAIARELGNARLWRGSQLLTWVLMPDHLHLLLKLGDGESLTQLIARMKAACAAAANHAMHSRDCAWAPAFHDRILGVGEDLAGVSRHLIANPIRAGLADDIWAWPFWRSQPLGAAPTTDQLRN